MTHFFLEQSTCFSNEQMFGLVNDVAKYSEFLPSCAASKVLSQSPTEVIAELRLKLGMLTQVFATKNTLSYPHSITMTKIYGPFKTLQGQWTFHTHESGSRICLELEYEFSNQIAGKMLTPLFSSLAKSMVQAFISRAQQLYG